MLMLVIIWKVVINMELWEQVKIRLQQQYPLTPLWNNCDEALIGTMEMYREEWVTVAVYDYDALVDIFHQDYRKALEEEENPDPESDPHTDAIECVDYNIVGAYIGKNTPMYISENLITGIVNLETKQEYYTQ